MSSETNILSCDFGRILLFLTILVANVEVARCGSCSHSYPNVTESQVATMCLSGVYNGTELYIEADLANETTVVAGVACTCQIEVRNANLYMIETKFGENRSSCGASLKFSSGDPSGNQTINCTDNVTGYSGNISSVTVDLEKVHDPYISNYCSKIYPDTGNITANASMDEPIIIVTCNEASFTTPATPLPITIPSSSTMMPTTPMPPASTTSPPVTTQSTPTAAPSTPSSSPADNTPMKSEQTGSKSLLNAVIALAVICAILFAVLMVALAWIMTGRCTRQKVTGSYVPSNQEIGMSVTSFDNPFALEDINPETKDNTSPDEKIDNSKAKDEVDTKEQSDASEKKETPETQDASKAPETKESLDPNNPFDVPETAQCNVESQDTTQ